MKIEFWFFNPELNLHAGSKQASIMPSFAFATTFCHVRGIMRRMVLLTSDNTKLNISFLGNSNVDQPNASFSVYYDEHATWLAPLPQSYANPATLFKFGSVIQPNQSATMVINRYFFNRYEQNLTLSGHWQFKSIPTFQAFTSLKNQIDKKAYVSVLSR
ncbi:hypothetical protein DR864_06180 [Runella rosea]|uniref:Uncharacterized protein n=1 Tax=Runella rosea TaxID=2259595 RepID=A0A344TFC6_9BACT|nr:hypothetical protein [Runella rosea]AXE17347.1 hypothetical protein DR864_06180 [Runella rosea]